MLLQRGVDSIAKYEGQAVHALKQHLVIQCFLYHVYSFLPFGFPCDGVKFYFLVQSDSSQSHLTVYVANQLKNERSCNRGCCL